MYWAFNVFQTETKISETSTLYIYWLGYILIVLTGFSFQPVGFIREQSNVIFRQVCSPNFFISRFQVHSIFFFFHYFGSGFWYSLLLLVNTTKILVCSDAGVCLFYNNACRLAMGNINNIFYCLLKVYFCELALWKVHVYEAMQLGVVARDLSCYICNIKVDYISA